MEFWNNNTEIQFFNQALQGFATPEQLFYHLKNGYFAYIPQGSDAEGQTLQGRNSLIGQFTETWCKNLFAPVAEQFGLYAVNSVVCEELGLNQRTSADLAFCCTNERIQQAKNVKLIFEIKMSIVSNYRYIPQHKQIEVIGDYKCHRGSPSLLRSDSMLKAIGKSINIRVSGQASSTIPVVILGNSPITENYIKKVDFLKTSGVIQGFWSLNPKPASANFIKETPQLGFQTIFNAEQLIHNCRLLLNEEMNYFSSMMTKVKLGNVILIASREKTDVARAEKFLTLIQQH